MYCSSHPPDNEFKENLWLKRVPFKSNSAFKIPLISNNYLNQSTQNSRYYYQCFWMIKVSYLVLFGQTIFISCRRVLPLSLSLLFWFIYHFRTETLKIFFACSCLMDRSLWTSLWHKQSQTADYSISADPAAVL